MQGSTLAWHWPLPEPGGWNVKTNKNSSSISREVTDYGDYLFIHNIGKQAWRHIFLSTLLVLSKDTAKSVGTITILNKYKTKQYSLKLLLSVF